MTPARRLELHINARVFEKYKGTSPVQIIYRASTLMQGLEVYVSVPGQSRSVLVQRSDLLDVSAGDSDVLDRITDEVLFAIFLLLDEDNDDN